MFDERALDASERALLEMVREGRVDAKIAVRLGVGTEDVRRRIAALASKLGVDGRQGLRAGRPPPADNATKRPWSSAWGLLLGVACAALIFGAGAWLGRSTAPSHAGSAADTSGGSSLTALAAEPTAAAVYTSAPPTPTRAQVAVKVIDGLPYADLGMFIVVPGHSNDAVTTVDRRAALTVLTVAGSGVVQFDGSQLHRVVNGSLDYAEASVGGARVAVFAGAADNNTTFAPNDTFSARGAGVPTLLVWATETRGPGQDTRGLRRYRATVDARGELYVSMSPISDDTVIDGSTGAALNVDAARFLGVVRAGFLSTGCEPPGLCGVAVQAGDFPAPATGAVDCDDAGTYTFIDAASQIRLRFEAFNGSTVPKCPATREPLLANDAIVNGYFVATAFDATGKPISVAVSPDGRMYAGDFSAPVGCPCFPHD